MRVLIVEDDISINESLKQILEQFYTVETAFNGEDGLYLASESEFDLLILDVMMPGMDGFKLLEEYRKHNQETPVIFVTGKDQLEDRIQGYKLSCDDYIIKPFDEEELLLRLKAVLKRRDKDQILKCGEIELHANLRSLVKGKSVVELKGRQYELLEYLFLNKNRILTKEQIFDRIWGINSDTGMSVVEVYTHAIRNQLKKVGCDHYLRTIRGIGYMLKAVKEHD